MENTSYHEAIDGHFRQCYNEVKEMVLVPTISSFFGISIRMYAEGDAQHHKPHIHAYYQDDDAEISFDGEVLSGGLPITQLKLVQAWLIIRQRELEENWNLVLSAKPVKKIKPID